MTRPIVLVHGAWHGAWCWELVQEQLDELGVRSVGLDLPSVMAPGASLADDGDAVGRLLDTFDEPVVLVGHSYAGAAVTDAGVHSNVHHVVYLTAFALDAGESVIENGLEGGESMTLDESLEFDGEVVRVDPRRVTEFFFHDCPPAVADAAVERLRPMSIAAMSGTPRRVAWRAKPSTYVVCTDDRALPVALQRSSARRVGPVEELPTSHSPFLSQPARLAELLAGISRR